MKRIISAGIAVLLIWSSCRSTGRQQTDQLKVGVSSGPEYELALTAQKVAKEQYGLDVELITFTEYVMPNEALNNGDIDLNVFQHVPYLEAQSRQRDYQLSVVGKTFVYPVVAYSRKISNMEELKAGSSIAIPNDPSNGGRALLLLQHKGLIRLKEGVGLLPKFTDITDNPKQLKILEIEAPQLPRVLDDEQVSMAIINNNFAAQAGLAASAKSIFREDSTSAYVNVIVAQTARKETPAIKDFVQAYQSEAVAARAREIFKDGAIRGW